MTLTPEVIYEMVWYSRFWKTVKKDFFGNTAATIFDMDMRDKTFYFGNLNYCLVS
jgi:hypothetical protein